MKHYTIFIKNVYEGVSGKKLAEEYGMNVQAIYQIIHREKFLRRVRNDPKLPTVEDRLEGFDNLHDLHERNGSVKLWRAIRRYLAAHEDIPCNASEKSEQEAIDRILNMTSEDILKLHNVGFKYASIFNDFKNFISKIY